MKIKTFLSFDCPTMYYCFNNIYLRKRYITHKGPTKAMSSSITSFTPTSFVFYLPKKFMYNVYIVHICLNLNSSHCFLL